MSSPSAARAAPGPSKRWRSWRLTASMKSGTPSVRSTMRASSASGTSAAPSRSRAISRTASSPSRSSRISSTGASAGQGGANSAPCRDDEQGGCAGDALHQAAEQLRGARVEPVRVLDQEAERALRAREQQGGGGFEHAVALLRRAQLVEPRGVVGEPAELREQRARHRIPGLGVGAPRRRAAKGGDARTRAAEELLDREEGRVAVEVGAGDHRRRDAGGAARLHEFLDQRRFADARLPAQQDGAARARFHRPPGAFEPRHLGGAPVQPQHGGVRLRTGGGGADHAPATDGILESLELAPAQPDRLEMGRDPLMGDLAHHHARPPARPPAAGRRG